MASKQAVKKAATKALSGRKQAAGRPAMKAPKRQRIPLADARARVTAILRDVGRRPDGELADELAGVLAVRAAQWPTRAAELLGRRLSAAEGGRLRRLQGTLPALPATLVSPAASFEPKLSGTL